MKHFLFFLSLGLLLLNGSSCTDPVVQVIPPVPEIELLNTSPHQVIEFQDEIIFTIEYTDGDGDLGTNDDTKRNVFVKDSRIDNIHEFRLQQLAPDGADIPITGTFELTLPYTILVGGSSPELVRFDIYVVDEAGNESNVVSSPEIQVNPQ